MLFEKRRRRRESHNAGKRYDCQIRILVYIYCAKKIILFGLLLVPFSYFNVKIF